MVQTKLQPRFQGLYNGDPVNEVDHTNYGLTKQPEISS